MSKSKACNVKAVAERAVQRSDLDSVIVRLTELRDVVRSSRYTECQESRIVPLAPISFSDCADCLVRAATDPSRPGKIVNVGQ